MAKYQQLYRMFDKQDRLLYVGISKSALERFAQHRETQNWIWDVVRMEIETHKCTRLEIQARERKAIRQERPVHNKAYAGTKAYDGKEWDEWPTVELLVEEYMQDQDRVFGESNGLLADEKQKAADAADMLLKVARNKRTSVLGEEELGQVYRLYLASSPHKTGETALRCMERVVAIIEWGYQAKLVPWDINAYVGAFTIVLEAESKSKTAS